MATVLGGPALFLVGYALFKWSLVGRLPVVYLGALGGVLMLLPLSLRAAPLLSSAGVTLVLVGAVSVWSWMGGRPSQVVAVRETKAELPEEGTH
jgi:hypothetical protein